MNRIRCRHNTFQRVSISSSHRIYSMAANLRALFVMTSVLLAACASAPTVTFTPTPLPAPTRIASAILRATDTPRPTNTLTSPTPAPPRTFTPTATINAQLESNSRAMLPIFFGYNNGAEAVRAGRWSDPQLQKAVADQKPGTLRYPAGTVANYWDWEQGWVFPSSNGEPYGMGKMKPTPNRLEDFQQTLNASGATPIFDLNLLTSNLDSQLAMLRHAKQIGFPIKYVELGNEFYLRRDDYAARFPTGADYGREASLWIAAIHKEFPDAKIAVVGAPRPTSFNRNDQRIAKWNADLFSVLKGADALTIHVYDSAGIGNSDTFKASDVATMLGTPFNVWDRLQRDVLPTIPAGLEVWITEYNLHDTSAPVHGTWAHGMFAVASTLLFCDSDKIALIDNHEIFGSAVFGAILGNENAFQMHSEFKPPTHPPKATPFARSASGWTLALFADATRGMTASQKIQFTPNPTLRSGAANITYPSVIGRTFSDGKRRSAFILNLASEAYTLKTDALNLTTFEQIYADPLSYISGAQSLTRVTGVVSSNTLLLPPYSVTRLSDGK